MVYSHFYLLVYQVMLLILQQSDFLYLFPIFLLVLLSWSIIATAQEEMSEGVITFKQTMSSDNDQMNSQFMMMGDLVTTTYFKKDKSRSELSNPMTGDVVSIFDSENGQMMMTMNNPMMGKVYANKSFSDIISKNPDVEIKKGAETKTLLGYECQQYIFTMSQDGVNVEMMMYATPKIKAIKKETLEFFGDFDGGFPLFAEKITGKTTSYT